MRVHDDAKKQTMKEIFAQKSQLRTKYIKRSKHTWEK